MLHGSDTCTEFGRVTNEQKVTKKVECSEEETDQTSERMQMHTCLQICTSVFASHVGQFDHIL